ncbi:MAG: bacteriohemerythrin [Actinomycetota bacterium]
MPRLLWEEWFEIGHDTIDFEHKVFFSLIHKLECLVEEARPRGEISRTMMEILKYAEFHFTSEENIMLEAGFSNLARHATMHRELLHRLKEDISTYEFGSSDGKDIVEFLFEWLLRHTIAEDIAISIAVKEKRLRTFFAAANVLA